MKDLTNIPEKYHPLFTTDFNKGVDSKMKILQRAELNDLFLEYNKWDIQRMIYSKKNIDDTIVGFV
jgi:hypothetical protein